MDKDDTLTARAETTIDTPIAKVWEALVTPATIKRYMFGTTVVSDWKQGSPIVWKGEWKGKAYEDKGVIRRLDRPRTLSYTHQDHLVTISLAEEGGRTRVSLVQDGNATAEARAHSEQNWKMMLDGLKKLLEG